MKGVPGGLTDQPELLDDAEERSVLAVLDEIAFHEVRMHGQVARRTVRHYDLDYGYESWQLVPTEPLPEPLWWLRERCAGFAGVPAPALAQTLVTRYPAGATLGWHRDAPMFSQVVVGVSLLSACGMRVQRRVRDERRVYEQELAPRSGYVLARAARSTWQHSIPAVPHLHYSITFRTLRNPERWLPAEAAHAVTDRD